VFGRAMLRKKPASAGFLFALLLAGFAMLAQAQDYAREKRWADDILATLMVGDGVWLAQRNGHRFLALYTVADKPRAAVIVAHGRGWSPDYELYGTLRTRLADAGYTTLSIQLPVLDGTAKLVDYIGIYPDARERFQLAVDFLKAKGYKNIAIVSHSLGASMANQYLIKTDDESVKAWVFIGIINGLEEMFRIKMPVLDVYGSDDWQVTRWGADERRAQILKIAGSEQVVVAQARHFFEGKEDALLRAITAFLDRVFR
jgi:pimeloyl-ACP methyl ester carboxylesterase